MEPFRRLLFCHRALAVLVLACALAMKLMVPAGWMPGSGAKLLTLSICADATGGATVRQIAVPMKDGHGDPAGKHAATDGLCAFAATGMAMAGAADAPLLAVVLAFILLLGTIARTEPAPRPALHLRPPLRGPPLTS